jgi:hypothetical protein
MVDDDILNDISEIVSDFTQMTLLSGSGASSVTLCDIRRQSPPLVGATV